MYQPRKSFLVAIALYAVLIKALPYLLSLTGMDLSEGNSFYPWSYTPLFALGLFSVAMFRDLRTGFLLPLAIWFAADVVTGIVMIAQYGFDEGLSYAIYPSQIFVYAGAIAVCGCGSIIRIKRNWGTIFASGLLGATLFYIISNFGVWAFDNMGMYPKTFSGLIACYVAGIPFFGKTVASTALFSDILFSPAGVEYLAEQSEPEAKTAPAPALEKQPVPVDV